MSLLLSEQALDSRIAVAANPLRGLASSLARDLEPLLSRELYFPPTKALLSRDGGRCARDGVLLDFDPFQPHEHRCPTCGEIYRGELHDRFWTYWYQLWLAERAVHAAALTRLQVDDRFSQLAISILEGYIERYQTYPNVDNVLGPTRLFFSTYLESIWLLQICIATNLLDATHPALTARVRDAIIEPSRAIIAEYDEGGSNRQVWNDAALLAAGRMLDDPRAVETAVFGPSGIVSHLNGGLLADGTWYEGENYHLFAHRGLWYGVTMAEQAGLQIPAPLLDRFQRGFATPFATALPDLTFPSRRDSQYAVSLRQWRVAEHCELGFARRADPELSRAIRRLYENDMPERDTGRSRSSADIEKNGPPSALSRSDLGWRALLCALPELPDLETGGPRSVLLESQGLAVFRRNEGRTYVALDYGQSGGGHGHPDRLNLLLVDGDTRWLDDVGTGSYVDPSLHWYRSTLAHNAPLVDGVSQIRTNGQLDAYDERGAAGWIVVCGDGIAPGAFFLRTVIVMPEYIIDELLWSHDASATVDLPIHADIKLHDIPAAEPDILHGGAGLEDGFNFLHDMSRQAIPAHEPVRGEAAAADGKVLSVWAVSDQPTDWWRATSLGPPGQGERAFRLLRSTSADGCYRFVMTWSDAVANVSFGDETRVTMRDGTIHAHQSVRDEWRIELFAGNAHSTIDLGGVRNVFPPTMPFVVDDPNPLLLAPPLPPPPLPIVLSRREPTVLSLGEPHYRRSEQTWRQAGKPRGSVILERVGDRLRVIIEMTMSDLTFVPAGAINPFDNDPADIHGDGVQLYLRNADGEGEGEGEGESAWFLVPTIDSDMVRVRQIAGWRALGQLHASWVRTQTGYRITTELPEVPSAIDVVVNEMPRGRTRRRGQLVLSGALGEFTYLRGDRHEPGRLIPLYLLDD
jgi:hypothetical protein